MWQWLMKHVDLEKPTQFLCQVRLGVLNVKVSQRRVSSTSAENIPESPYLLSMTTNSKRRSRKRRGALNSHQKTFIGADRHRAPMTRQFPAVFSWRTRWKKRGIGQFQDSDFSGDHDDSKRRGRHLVHLRDSNVRTNKLHSMPSPWCATAALTQIATFTTGTTWVLDRDSIFLLREWTSKRCRHFLSDV